MKYSLCTAQSDSLLLFLKCHLYCYSPLMDSNPFLSKNKNYNRIKHTKKKPKNLETFNLYNTLKLGL